MQTELNKPSDEVLADESETHPDLVMNAAVGAIETMITSYGIDHKHTEWFAHEVAIRILRAHADGEVTY